MTRTDLLTKIDTLFRDRGADEYHGEAVTQLEHALQSAWAAEQDNSPPALIVAALLHDIGHLLQAHGEHAAERGIDDRHENLGMRFLQLHFGPEVTEPVRLHVAAKRYLTAVEPEYRRQLSAASELSLQLQGGPMTEVEWKEFESNPQYQSALRLRRWDDIAKVPGLQTPPLEHFRGYF